MLVGEFRESFPEKLGLRHPDGASISDVSFGGALNQSVPKLPAFEAISN